MTSLYTFKKNDRLKSEKQIDRLFKEGKSRSSGCLRMIYLFIDEELTSHTQAMFSVPKRFFKRAVKRNLLKRRIREAYRLKKPELVSILSENNKNLLIAFLFRDPEEKPFSEIESSVQQLVTFLQSKSRLTEKEL